MSPICFFCQNSKVVILIIGRLQFQYLAGTDFAAGVYGNIGEIQICTRFFALAKGFLCARETSRVECLAEKGLPEINKNNARNTTVRIESLQLGILTTSSKGISSFEGFEKLD